MFDKHVDEAVEAEIWLKADAKVLELQKNEGVFSQKNAFVFGGSGRKFVGDVGG